MGVYIGININILEGLRKMNMFICDVPERGWNKGGGN